MNSQTRRENTSKRLEYTAKFMYEQKQVHFQLTVLFVSFSSMSLGY